MVFYSNVLNNAGASVTYGVRSEATGTATGSKYGVAGYAISDGTEQKYGVFGIAQGSAGNKYGVMGGGITYGVFANGNLGSSGVKSFAIDHPLDPANKYLKHFSIESPEVLNLYRGNTVFDAKGEAIVQLPDYFNAVNNDNYTYLLTPIGANMQLFIKEEITSNQFTIAGGLPNMKVSWEVKAERDDPYLKYYPESREVVTVKKGYEKGKYTMPELYGKPKEYGIHYVPKEENRGGGRN